MPEDFEFALEIDLANIAEDLEDQILREVQARFGKLKSGDDIQDYEYIFRCHVTMK